MREIIIGIILIIMGIGGLRIYYKGKDNEWYEAFERIDNKGLQIVSIIGITGGFIAIIRGLEEILK